MLWVFIHYLNSAHAPGLPREPRADRRGTCAFWQRKHGVSKSPPGGRLKGAALSSTKKVPQAGHLTPIQSRTTILPASVRRTTTALSLRLPPDALPSSDGPFACMPLAHKEQRVPPRHRRTLRTRRPASHRACALRNSLSRRTLRPRSTRQFSPCLSRLRAARPRAPR